MIRIFGLVIQGEKVVQREYELGQELLAINKLLNKTSLLSRLVKIDQAVTAATNNIKNQNIDVVVKSELWGPIYRDIRVPLRELIDAVQKTGEVKTRIKKRRKSAVQ